MKEPIAAWSVSILAGVAVGVVGGLLALQAFGGDASGSTDSTLEGGIIPVSDTARPGENTPVATATSVSGEAPRSMACSNQRRPSARGEGRPSSPPPNWSAHPW